MTSYPLGLAVGDRELWDAATALLRREYRTERHEVAAAVRLASGRVVTGIHLAGSAGRSSLCAEGVALGAALVAGELEVETVLAVLARPTEERTTWRVIAPCGVCRELLVDHAPCAAVYVHVPDPDASAPAPLLAPAPTRGLRGDVALAPGRAERMAVAGLLPGKNLRPW